MRVALVVRSGLVFSVVHITFRAFSTDLAHSQTNHDEHHRRTNVGEQGAGAALSAVLSVTSTRHPLCDPANSAIVTVAVVASRGPAR